MPALSKYTLRRFDSTLSIIHLATYLVWRGHGWVRASTFNGYLLISQDRNTRGGGVAMYVRDSYKVTILATSDTTVKYKPYTTEYILGYVNINKTEPVLISVGYRPPDASYLTMQLFTDHLKLYSGNYKSKIIMGDLNANFLQTTGHF